MVRRSEWSDGQTRPSLRTSPGQGLLPGLRAASLQKAVLSCTLFLFWTPSEGFCFCHMLFVPNKSEKRIPVV